VTTPLLIEAESLARHYRVKQGFLSASTTLRALDGVSFALGRGQTLAVVGESGCGKSTLARQITLIESPTSGSLRVEGRDVSTATGTERRQIQQKVQIIFQDPFASLNPRKKVGAILEEPLVINTSSSAAERAAKAREMMERVGLRPEHYNRYPHMFSGGQRQRIAIARALMLNPSVVVADEPVSALDVSIQAQALNLLIDLQEEFGLAYIFISHDLSVVRHIADEVMVMYLGRPVEQGTSHTIFERPLHPYTQALLASTPHVDPKQRRRRVPLTGEIPSPLDPPAGCAFNTRCPFATEACEQERPMLRTVYERLVACHHTESIVTAQ
jgi:dipeptide transport system ATP-binding protein